ncbi:MAG: PAS domain-containing protein [Planctomycetales bacterium]|nr:PAS domain-containing protein [Planctomycetales bacterium]
MISNKITARLAFIYIFLCLVPTIAACVFLISWEQQIIDRQIEERLEDATVFLVDVFEEGLISRSNISLSDIQSDVARLGENLRIRITLIDRSGKVLADSGKSTLGEVAAMDLHDTRPEILAAKEHGRGEASRFSDTVGAPFVYVARSVEQDNVLHGYVRASVRASTVREQVVAASSRLGLLALLVGSVNLFMIYYVVRSFMKRMSDLRHAADLVATGDLQQRVGLADHIDGGLGRSFNRMTSELAVNVDSVRERSEQLATVLGGMVEGVIAIDSRQRVLFANRSAATLLGFKAETATGNSLLETVRLQPLHTAATEAFETGEQTRLDADVGGGVNRSLTIRATPLPGKPCPGVVLVILDVTELRRLEGLRQEFIANVSHELKTPLSSIKAYTETLLNGALQDTNNNERFVRRIAEQADRLHDLILDMLSLARIESAEQSYEITPISIADVVEKSLSSHQDSAAHKNIQLVTKPPQTKLFVRAESEALRQILDNLVKNAIMYTGEGGIVTVQWDRDSRDTAMVAIKVVDTGIGIDKKNHARLFERFFRVDKARSREQGGTGLGLSIVKHLTQFLNGTVAVESVLGEGATFTVCLPKAEC